MFSTLHAGAQTNRGTRSLFLSGGCGGGGTKSLRLPPRPSLASLSISVYLSFSTTAFFPHFPLRLSRRQSPVLSSATTAAAVAAFLSLSLYPFATTVLLALFSLLATPLFMPPHSPGPSLSHVRISPSLFLPFSTVLPLAPELNHLRRFFADTVPAAPLSLRRANRSRTRASEREDRNREENEGMRDIEGERSKRRWNPSTVYTRASENAPRESRREREAGGRRERDQGRCTGEERWDTPRAERGRGRREAADGKARTCERDATRTRERDRER